MAALALREQLEMRRECTEGVGCSRTETLAGLSEVAEKKERETELALGGPTTAWMTSQLAAGPLLSHVKPECCFLRSSFICEKDAVRMCLLLQSETVFCDRSLWF